VWHVGGRQRTADGWHCAAGARCSCQPISLDVRIHLDGAVAAPSCNTHELLVLTRVSGDAALAAWRGDDAAVVPEPARRSSEPERDKPVPPSDETLMA
jgi:hypothetical protein